LKSQKVHGFAKYPTAPVKCIKVEKICEKVLDDMVKKTLFCVYVNKNFTVRPMAQSLQKHPTFYPI
ncbi:hypothetical protein NB498_15930, partial [Vibrio alginolyticus]|uniref:hypothetical protein n=1 Tax=Vibrio alginolyticus TaxID=663 RepID=UPI00215B7834